MRWTFALTCLICLLQSSPRPAAADPSGSGERAEASVDLYGDPLPSGAISRLGSAKLRAPWVQSVALSPDGRVLASGGARIRFWDVSTGRMLREFPTGASVVAFSPDGTRLATGDGGGESQSRGTVRLWEVSTGRQLFANDQAHITEGRLTEPVDGLAWSPDGRWFASVSGGNEVHLWNAGDGSRLRSLTVSDKRRHASGFALSPDGRIIAVSSRNEIQLWDLTADREPRIIEQAHPATINSLAFTADGRRLISAGYGGESPRSQIRVWNPATGEATAELWNAEPDPHGTVVTRLTVSRDGELMVSNRGDELRLWKLPSGKLADVIQSRLVGQSPVLSPDDRLVATISGSHTIRLWETTTGRERFSTPGAHRDTIRSVAWSPDGATIGTASFEGTVCLWEPETGRLKHELSFSGERTTLYALAFSPDGRTVAAPGDHGVEGRSEKQGAVKLWDVRSGELVREIPLPARGRVVAFSPDGRRLAACTTSSTGFAGDPGPNNKKPTPATVSVFDVETGETLFSVEGGGDLHHLAFTSDGKSLLFAPQVRRWDFAQDKPPQPIAPDTYTFGTITAMSVDGRWLALGYPQRRGLGLVELSTGRTVWEQPGNVSIEWRDRTFGYNALEFSNDGRLLMARGPAEEGEDIVIEVRTGNIVRRLPSTTSALSAVGFSPDGSRVVSGSGDGTALIWDLKSASSRTPQKPSTEEAWNELWEALADPDAGRAYDAVWTLTALGTDAVEFLGRRLKPAAAPDQQHIGKLIVALDDSDYETRRDASRELRAVARMVQKQLHEAAENPASAELRKRADALLIEARNPLVSLPEEMRSLRAIEILERVGSPQARRVLQMLSRGAPGAIETEESQAALARWNGS